MKTKVAEISTEAILTKKFLYEHRYHSSMGAFITDLWSFAKERKRWWLLPLFLLIVIVGIIVVVAQTTVVPPLIYALF